MRNTPDQSAISIAHLQARVAELEQQLEARNADLAEHQEYRSYAPLLGMLLEVSAALRITHDIPAVLTLLEEKVPLLFNARTRALIFLIDDQQQLVLRTPRFDTSVPLVLGPGQGVEGHSVRAPRAMLFAQRELSKHLEELSAAQQAQLEQVLAPDWPPHSAIASSLRVHETLVGVLVLYNRSTTTPFIASELPFVQALADLAAVAIVDVQQRADLSHARAMHARAQAQLDSAQAQLLQSARLAAVGELAASVAHEINNPLYAARNSLFLAARKIAPDAPAREYVQLAQDELGRIAGIISRMRDFYRPTREELALTDLNQLLEETLALVQTHLRHGHVVVQFFPDPHLPPLIVSADQIRQVILNLVLNACDAMALHGGTLTVRSATVDGRAATETRPSGTGISHFATGVTIAISDTGVGIPPEIVAQLFTPFFTTKPQGTGLGLAISGHIATQHGGHISVESVPGQGSTFTIYLPLEIP